MLADLHEDLSCFVKDLGSTNGVSGLGCGTPRIIRECIVLQAFNYPTGFLDLFGELQMQDTAPGTRHAPVTSQDASEPGTTVAAHLDQSSKCSFQNG